MPILQRGQEAEFVLATGGYVSVDATGGGIAEIAIPSGLPGGPLRRVADAAATFSGLPAGTLLTVSCVQGTVGYAENASAPSPGGRGAVTASSLADTLEGAAATDPASLARIQSSVSGASTDAGNLIAAGTDNKLKLVGSAIVGWLAGLAANLGIGTASPLARFHVAAGNICVDNTYGFQGRLSSGPLATLMRYKADNKAYIGPNEEIVLDGSCYIAPPGELTLSAGVASSTGPTIRPKSGITINVNGLMAFDAVSNTQVALKFRGTDGVTRSIVFTLS